MVVIRAAGHDVEAFLKQGGGQRLRIGHDSMGIGLEFRLERLAKSDRLRRDDMHQRAALKTGEDRGIELLRDLGIIGENHAAARTAQGLVRRRGDDMRMREGRGMRAAGNQPGEMRHVDEKIGADRIRDLPEGLEIPDAGIAGAAGDNDLRLVLMGEALDLRHVDPRLGIEAIGHGLEPAPAHIDRRAMGQVAARREIEAHEGIARLHQREEDALIGLAAGIGLHIGEGAAEQLAGALNGEFLGDINELAAAIIALARITFGVFVRHHRTLRLKHGAGDDVLGSDQFDLVALAAKLQRHGLMQRRIGISERGGKEAVRADGGRCGHERRVPSRQGPPHAVRRLGPSLGAENGCCKTLSDKSGLMRRNAAAARHSRIASGNSRSARLHRFLPGLLFLDLLLQGRGDAPGPKPSMA